MENYKEFKIKTEPYNAEIISGLLWQLNILGINEFDDYLTIFVKKNSEITVNEISALLDKAKEENIIDTFEIGESVIRNKNWNEEWEKKINIVEVTEKIVIKPTFKNYNAKEGQIIITIDPKMSFGTGEHATTKIVLMLLEKYLTEGNKVLDVGSGTAVLSIAASKLGAEKVFAIDNDEWCYLNGNENVEKNNLDNITVLHTTIDKIDENDFDLIVANINKNVLLEIKNEIVSKCRSKATVILSGILETDGEEIKRQFARMGLTALEQKQIDEWIGIVFIKKPIP